MARESMFDDTDFEALIDDKEYMRSEENALEEQVITNPSQFSRSYDDFKADQKFIEDPLSSSQMREMWEEA